jgi:hypothetical protein
LEAGPRTYGGSDRGSPRPGALEGQVARLEFGHDGIEVIGWASATSAQVAIQACLGCREHHPDIVLSQTRGTIDDGSVLLN